MLPVPPPIATDFAQPPTLDDSLPGSWQRELACAVRTSEELLRRLNLIDPGESLERASERLGLLTLDFAESAHKSARESGDEQESVTRVAEILRRFPVLVPENFLNRMRTGDPSDPLLRQVLPLAAESVVVDGFISDAVGDLSARRTRGVLQKYAGRVLLIAASSCAVHCRYCFRRDYPYEAEPRRLDEWQSALTEISLDSSISEVIFSGGDPWMLSDMRLKSLCSAIDAIPHIERIRFHTRLPIVLPSRVTDELLMLFSELRSQSIVVVHSNHANEIVGDCELALRRLVKSGIPVLNQSVLLKGVNDSVDAMEALSRRLINIGVMPYYLHQLDQVTGAAHFEVGKPEGQEIIRQLSTRLPGYALPRYVQEIPGDTGKSPISS